MSTNPHPAFPLRVSRAGALQFRVLGPVEVLKDGDLIVLRRRHRTLLALLLTRVNEFVSIDWLMDELWTGEPPHTARASLQNSVCQLRKSLGAAALLTGSESYALNVKPEQLDSEQFRLTVSESRLTLNAEPRARMLRKALALWRGPAFADIAKTPSLSLEASLLNELRLSTLEDAIDADLEGGRDAELVPELEQLITDEPYRERLRTQLMLALYRAGRQQRALAVFNEGRQTLLLELGLEPTPPLRQLERAILNHDPALAARLPSLPASREPPASEQTRTQRRATTWLMFEDSEPRALVFSSSTSETRTFAAPLLAISQPASSHTGIDKRATYTLTPAKTPVPVTGWSSA